MEGAIELMEKYFNDHPELLIELMLILKQENKLKAAEKVSTFVIKLYQRRKESSLETHEKLLYLYQ